MVPQGPGMGPPPGGMGPPPGGMGPVPPGGAEAPPTPGQAPTNSFTMMSYLSGITFGFKDCLFYAPLVQIILITYMYIRVGKGKMWKIFFYGGLSLFIGQTLEHVLLPLTQYKETYKFAFLSYMPLEVFYIIAEYSIPFINYLKLKAITRTNYIEKIRILIFIVFPFYATTRFLMGYFRYQTIDVNPDIVRNFKGASATIVAVLDMFISILIIYELKQNLGMERMQHKYLRKTSVYSYIRKSNYAVLLLIDFVGFCLSFLSYSYVSPAIMDIVMPFQTLKDNFLLILSVDAIIFKVDCFKMLSSGKTVNPNGKSSFTTSYTGATSYMNSSTNGTSYINNTTNASINNYNGSYGVLSNYGNSSVNNYSSNNGGGVLASSQPLFSGVNKFSNDIGKPEFGSFHAANALNHLEEESNKFTYNGNVKPNYNVNFNDNDEKHYYNDTFPERK